MPIPFILALAENSLRVSVVIVFVLCLRPALRRWVGSRAVAGLWLVIAARLLCPWPVTLPWHIPSPFTMPRAVAVSPAIVRVSVATADNPVLSRADAPAPPTAPAPTNFAPTVLFLLWLSGASLAAARLARGCWTTRRWAARTLPSDADSGVQAVFLALPAELRRGVGLRFTDFLDVPTLVGILRPQIWLPRTLPDALTSAELRHVLLHELGHARRRDLLTQWLFSLTCCLHWFNPLIWLLAHLARTDRELACDAWVLSRDATQTETASYGYTLLKVVQGMGGSASRALPVVSMAAGRRHLGLRVREIRAFRPVASWRGVAALGVLSALVAAGTLQSAPAGPPPTGTVNPTTPVAAASPAASPVPSSPVSPPPVPRLSARPRQVEIESKFIEIAKSNALTLEKSGSPSSPVAQVFHQVFARFAAQASLTSPTIFRSAPVPSDDFGVLIRRLNETKGVDLLSAPRVTTKSGQKATIEIIREFIYPTTFQQDKGPFDKPVATPTNFDKKNTGVTLEVTPTIEPGGKVIDLSLTWTITNFDGFVDADGKPISANEKEMPEKMPGASFPVFDTHSVSTVATLSSGATLVFSSDDQHLHAQKSLRFAVGEAKHEASTPTDGDRLLLVFVTATLVDPQGVVDHPFTPVTEENADPSPPSTDASASLPYGVPVPGKPGFATSPYAPDAGIVDLRDFPRGKSVRDPYTGKQFLVP